MIWKRQLAIFGLAFVLVLGGGMALAAVGSLGGSDEGAAPAEETYEEPADEPTPEVDFEEEGDHEEEATGDEEATHDENEATDREEEAAQDEEATHDEEDAKEEPQDTDEAHADEPDTTPPGFEILSPANGTRLDNKVVTFEGYVEPGSTVTRGQFSAQVDGEHWRIALVLSPGKNIVGFVATDAAGNKADDSVTLYYDPPKAEEEDDKKDKEDGGDDEPGFVEFSANQKYGSCAENPPYDVFFGTATPGTKIWIESPYGGTSTTANGDGQWSAKVTFWEAPVGKTFEVVIESSEGDRKVFAFTHTGGEGEEEGDGGEEEGGGEEH